MSLLGDLDIWGGRIIEMIDEAKAEIKKVARLLPKGATYLIVAQSTMARMCTICGKTKRMGNIRKLLRGHYNVTGRRSFDPNLQWTRVDGHRTLACVRCIRSQHKLARPSA